MKQILLLCCFLALMQTTRGQAHKSDQQQTVHQLPTVSQADFQAKVVRLNELLDNNKVDEAIAAFEDLQRMMQRIYRQIDGKLELAEYNENIEDKTKYQQMMSNQKRLYNTIKELKKDILTNRTTLNKNLSEFMLTIL